MSSHPSPDSTRRPGVPCREVTLADGRTWGLALPAMALHPVVHRQPDAFGRTEVQVEFVTRLGYPLEARRRLDQVVAAAIDDDEEGSRLALVCLAVVVLRLAHEVGLEEAEALLDPRAVDLAEVARALFPAACSATPSGRR